MPDGAAPVIRLSCTACTHRERALMFRQDQGVSRLGRGLYRFQFFRLIILAISTASEFHRMPCLPAYGSYM